MGMANSDDEMKIMEEWAMMERIKSLHPEYGYDTHNLSEDMKAIYDADLRDRHLQRGVYAPNYNYPVDNKTYYETYYEPIQSKARRDSRPSYAPKEDEEDVKIRKLKKQIEIAKLEKELAALKKK